MYRWMTWSREYLCHEPCSFSGDQFHLELWQIRVAVRKPTIDLLRIGPFSVTNPGSESLSEVRARPAKQSFLPLVACPSSLSQPLSPENAIPNDPTGRSPKVCPAPFEKTFWFSEIANHFYIHGRPASLEGRCATSRNAERDAVDAGTSLDGRLRLADGEGVWS